MPAPIQRLNYHTGLFLEEVEFKLEQNYHMLMRQRINYALFQPGVVYGMNLEYSGGVLKVKPGMAVDEYIDPDNGPVGREIVVLEDVTVSLSGYSAGDNVWITAEWAFSLDAPKAPTNLPARITNRATFTSSTSNPGTGTTRILLGKIVIGMDATVTPTQRTVLRLGGLGGAPASLTGVTVTPASLIVATGGTAPLAAVGTFSDSTTRALTSADGITWISSNTGRATVDSAGVVTGVAPGAVTITAQVGSLSATSAVTVASSVTLVSIAVTPNPTTVEVGSNVALTATGHYSDGSSNTMAAGSLVWSSDNSAVATVSAAGLVSGVAAGTAHVNAVSGGITGSATVQVNAPAAHPVIVLLDPSSAGSLTTGLQVSNGTLDIHGQSIRDSSLAANVTASGTVVRFMKGGVVKIATNPLTRLNDASGNQVVRVTVPDRSGTSWSATEVVTLQLEFGGGTATASFQYDD